MGSDIKVLIVDDSVIYRKSLSDILNQVEQCSLVHTAPNAEIALRKMSSQKYTMVITDINMPGINGFELQKKIKQTDPQVQVVLMSSENYSQASLTIEALNNGAVDFIQKPTAGTHESNRKALEEQVLRIAKTLYSTITLSTDTKIKSPPPLHAKPVQPNEPKLPSNTKAISAFSNYTLLAIGVSTGGPQALGKIIPLLPKTLKIPVVIVQHMPANFTKSLAESLDKKSALTVKEAQPNDALSPGMVYIAPGGKQMAVRKSGTRHILTMNDDPPENSCKPAVDYTFRSISKEYPNEAILSIILTGMGSDGCIGVEILKGNQCYCISQSQKSCVVYGMPKAVDDAGLSDISIDIEVIAKKIIELVR